MTNEKIHQLVKNLEPLFLGFAAHEDRLKNSNGMELRFYSDWSGKTTVSGLHASHRYSIGCSFEKPIEKIFKDIRRRLMPGYHADFFETKREKLERAEAEEAAKLKLKALISPRFLVISKIENIQKNPFIKDYLLKNSSGTNKELFFVC